MSNGDLKAELDAIGEVVAALRPLNEAARARVMEYVRMVLGLPVQEEESHPSSSAQEQAGPPPGPPGHPATDIRTLREEKRPTSDVQMAALVAYYLAEVAPEGERQTEISSSDLETYFKQAQHPLPKVLQNTLPHAKAAGFFDSVEHGVYRLNRVGHNLVVHKMPIEGATTPRRSRPQKKPAAKPPKGAAKQAPQRTKAAAKPSSTKAAGPKTSPRPKKRTGPRRGAAGEGQ